MGEQNNNNGSNNSSNNDVDFDIDFGSDSQSQQQNNNSNQGNNNNNYNRNGNNNNGGGYNSNNNNYGNNNGNRYGNGGNGYSRSGGYNNKPKVVRNIIGECSLNLWDKDRITPKELDTNNIQDVKIITLSMPTKTFKLSDNEKDNVLKVLQMFKDKEYKVRFICNNIRAIYDDVIKIFGIDNAIHVTPWVSYCKDSSEELPLHLVTNDNIEAAAYHVKDYLQKSPGFQYAYAGTFSSLYGQKNDEFSSYVITFDPFKDGFKIDFEKSRDNVNLYLLQKPMKLDIYNLAVRNDYNDIVDLLK